jgi:O-antigen ligase
MIGAWGWRARRIEDGCKHLDHRHATGDTDPRCCLGRVHDCCGIGLGASWFDEQRIVMLVVMAGALLVVIAKGVPFGTLSWIPPALSLAVAFGLVSAPFAPRLDAAMIEWAIVTAIWTFALGSGLKKSAVGLAAVILSTIPATAYVTGVAANYAFAIAVGWPIGAETLLAGFSNPRFPAQLQALTLPLFPLAWRQSERVLVRAPLAIVWALWWMCLFGSGSRTGWLPALAASLVVLVCGREGRTWLLVQAMSAAAGALLLWLAFFVVPSVFGIEAAHETGRLSSTASIHARLALWQAAIDMAWHFPLLGVGPMHFAYSYNGLAAHPHNWWLQVAAEWGVPALIAFAVAFVVSWRGLAAGIRARVGEGRSCSPERTVVIGAFAAWSIGILFDGYMVAPTSQLLSAAILALVVAELGEHRQSLGEPISRRLEAWIQRGLALSALFVMASLPWSSLGDPEARETSWRRAHPGEALWPRLCEQG